MDLAKSFVFEPLPAVDDGQDAGTREATGGGFRAAAVEQAAAPAKLGPLGRLADLRGKWQGTGFNVIWRPNFSSDTRHFLELNLTEETLEFQQIAGPIPNRGLVQRDINMRGLNYLQQITDKNLGAGLHFEPGIWAHVPATSHPKVGESIVRMATIPHGSAIVAQGLSSAADDTKRPDIPATNIIPFGIGNPKDLTEFDELHLKKTTKFRTSGPGLKGITQRMLDDPNSVLRDAIAHQNITSTVRLQVNTATKAVLGGGLANTAFLEGDTEPNAVATRASATFWLEKLDGEDVASQLQYTQNVRLDFDQVSWPHITVATLRRVG